MWPFGLVAFVKKWFPNFRKSKLIPRADGPFSVLEKINVNAYKRDFSIDFGVSPTFKIADLKPYLGGEDEFESRMTQMQGGEDDEDIHTIDTSTPAHKQISVLITHARAHQLNYQVTSVLASRSSYLDNANMCSLLLLRNGRQDQNRDGFTRARFRLQNSTKL
jgi:hypothetical protein